MWKLKEKLKLPKPEEGFSMLEVLVTALVTVGFLLGALQATTLATLLRIQAQRKTDAVNYINQDKQLIEYEALTQPEADDTYCDITALRDRLIALGYNGTNNDTPNSSTIITSNEQNIQFLNKNTYRLGRIYTVLSDTLQITWHIWDEGTTVSDTTANNPNLAGNNSAGDSDDSSITIIVTEVIPNIGECP